jgi:hypothetical protein
MNNDSSDDMYKPCGYRSLVMLRENEWNIIKSAQVERYGLYTNRIVRPGRVTFLISKISLNDFQNR